MKRMGIMTSLDVTSKMILCLYHNSLLKEVRIRSVWVSKGIMMLNKIIIEDLSKYQIRITSKEIKGIISRDSTTIGAIKEIKITMKATGSFKIIGKRVSVSQMIIPLMKNLT
ncbi:hypothetical protein HanPI659440_Chr15g0586961 [Helianthus annuus]|nr:hypothetical protein HanPI659440_Chr15g0586961 [Helianthus annuus]